MFDQLPSLILLVLGFGFVIFWHELGHFFAAKWVGIRVEQFAVGFGQAMLSFRKGMGVTFGSSGKKYDELVAAGQADGIGETEYRLNWIPLGGYVKMLGQDDLRANAQQDDPRAYNKKSIGARMFVVSAGVIMNILLAAFGFMVVFSMPGGFRVQPAQVGSVIPNSPAARTTRLDGAIAPLSPGDRILMFDDKWQHDFTKITLNVALSGEGNVPMYVRRLDGTEERLNINPDRMDGEPSGFLMIGVGPPFELRGLDKDREIEEEIRKDPKLFVPKEMIAVQPGETITAINGQTVKVHEFWKLNDALQSSNGQPVTLTVTSADGKTREEQLRPRFAAPFDGEVVNFAGLVPRAVIDQINTNSAAKGKLMPGDVVVSIAYQNKDKLDNPTVAQVRSWLEKAGKNGQSVDFLVLRDGKEVSVPGLLPNVKLPGMRGVKGLNVSLSLDHDNPVVAEVIDKTPAQKAGIPSGSTVTAINGQPVKSWHDVKRLMSQATAGAPLKVTARTSTGDKEFALDLSKETIERVAGFTYTTVLINPAIMLHERVEPRKTDNPLTAAAWGVTETRDFVLQFYLTLHRMVQGSVSYKNMMGPVGIFNAGRQFAYKGNDWLIWFLAMISANLAVVNFLPIPIVDGGLFLFLVIEKIQGKAISPKTQSIAQVVGLAIILSVFLLVTYQDIARMVP
ncbi:MAG: regulator of sigma protease [Phycisphaerales bacterium]|jgi:regulator of sigma E protease|nr:regulator of sigma protease [Phycisphaerales bacterium]